MRFWTVMSSYRAEPSRPDRAKAIAAVMAVYAVMIGAMLMVRTDTSPRTMDTTLPVLIEIVEPPPPPPEPHPGQERREEGAAGKKADPTPVVMPKPKIIVPAQSPIPAAPIAGTGSSPNAGAATAGAGPGAGGTGSGRGGGGAGGGSRAEWLSGGLRNSDYPRSALRDKLQGRVSVRFTVLISGRIADCRIIASSGSPVLDATTCRLLTERLRFRPAMNSAGVPIQSEVGSDYTWGINFRRY
ncbi:energy transducer TonB [Sphingomonas sp. G124]|uniref:Protein TonB n=1 Tax=Sphingomonas cremea TaxID=2904799 RepID=A0A9X1QNP3_9SPHN|nr:energy transducer TonB [Sphingomonas cremea]MCF2515472.1 energy transducer TonB [Sphingomonas cremea]